MFKVTFHYEIALIFSVPWGISGTAPPAPPPAGPPPSGPPPPPPAPASSWYYSSPPPYQDNSGYTTTSWSTPCPTGMSGAMVQNVQNLGDGTIQPIGDPPSATDAPAPAPAPAATGSSDSSTSDESNDFGGTAGK